MLNTILNITKVNIYHLFSKYPPENSYVHLCDDEVRTTKNYKI